MDAVLTCMVDERIGPGEMNARFIQSVKEFFKCDGAVAVRSPSIALKYAMKALGAESGTPVMISALAPSWQILALEEFGYTPLVLDVDEATALVTADIVSEGIKKGGRILLLHEANGIMPDMDAIASLGIPVIEDISQSVGSSAPPPKGTERTPAEAARARAGLYGVCAILSLEDLVVFTAGGVAVVMAGSRRDWFPL